jgi:hypothetical protein
MSERFNDGVLQEKFDTIIEKLDRIEAQTTKTNGSVRSLQGSRQYTYGALTIITALVLPTLGFLSYQIIKNSEHIAAIDAIITQLESTK